ncbi:MAG: Gfo/Idh/MocA family oxidoreductase [Defluviitaleaceae bacterium]|nr:Gfo/Idh/MocA family oxidoreductase [Defluviitaleaceae bacterium]
MKIKFGLYGSGWRAEFFLRVAKLLPGSFEIVGLVTRSDEKVARFTQEFGVRCYKTPEEMLTAASPDFVVVSIAASANVEVSLKLLGMGVPVLLETPPATSLESLIHFHKSLPAGAKIQVAEQYPFQPMHAARLAFVAGGKLGQIQHTQVSYSHGYHAVALIRQYLGVAYENAEITATAFPVNVVGGYTRAGEPTHEAILQKTQTIAVLKFSSGKTGIVNFEGDQHRSWVRSHIIQVKGDRGEIFNHQIKYLQNFNTPIETKLKRKTLGTDDNFEGVDLKGIQADGAWQYRNPHTGSRLVDDEIAIAHLLANMANYTKGGQPAYSLNQGLQDMYLSLLIDQAVKEGRAVVSETQAWCE